MGQWICKKFQRLIIRIHCHSFVNITLHGVGVAIITYHSERFVWSEQTVSTAESLNDVLIFHHLIYIERIYPFGVEACQHLIHYYKKVYLLVFCKVLSIIRFLMGKAQCNILLERSMGRHSVSFAKLLLITFKHLYESFFLKRLSSCIIYIRIE